MIGGYSIAMGLNPIEKTKDYTIYQLYHTVPGRKIKTVEIKRFHDGKFRNRLWQYIGICSDEDLPSYVLAYLDECIRLEYKKDK